MACDCEEYICVNAFYNPCATGVTVNIVATESGTWNGHIEFNGMFTAFAITVTEDEPIVLPTSLLNEFYTHELKLYDVAGDLVACYHLNARSTPNAAEADVVPPGGALSFDIVVTETDGTYVTDAKLANKNISTISTDGQDYNRVFWTKPYASDTLTAIAGLIEFRVNQVITVTTR